MMPTTSIQPSAVADLIEVSARARARADGKFLRVDGHRFFIKGVTYGTFAPDSVGYQLPKPSQVDEDFRLMAGLGINTVRVYTSPHRDLLDQAARHGLRVMVGLPWSQHIAFLDDSNTQRKVRRDVVAVVRELGNHPATLMFALGNEIPANVVRWHGRLRVERFLRQLYQDARDASPASLFTYVNFPPTEFLDLSFFDVCAFNVYLHRETELRAYLTRLQHVAGHKPLLLAEVGADSYREGLIGQAKITAAHIRSAFREGACGAIAFTWTDEWWRGGQLIDDWAFGLVDSARRPKPAAAAVGAAFADAPFPAEERRMWPRVSVVVCAYNASDTIEDCLSSLERLDYPDYEVLVVNDGSHDATSSLAGRFPSVRVIDIPNGGLSTARNVGLAEASGEIIAYTDADTRADPEWLTYLVQPFLGSDVVAAGGPNVVPPDDPPMAQCIARAPGAPTHVLLDDRNAEHVPGCNMAFRRDALLAIGGFNTVYLRAGDDVDVCWRLQGRGGTIGFAPSALVWHHHRNSIRAYWKQQVGYGEGERWLMAHHPEKFLDGRMIWHGRIYSPLPFVRSLWGERVNAGIWGTAAFPSVYRTDVHPFAFLPHSVRWQLLSFLLTICGVVVAVIGDHPWAVALLLGAGLAGIATTIAKNIAYAMRSDVDTFSRHPVWHRAVVASLHFIQPFARLVGQIHGALSPPDAVVSTTPRRTSAGPWPPLAESWRALRILSGRVVEERFWSESWTSAERVLSRLTEWLRRSRSVQLVEIDEGWSADRDLSVPVSRWAWIDVRALVEDHGSGRSLLRISTHLRPTTFGVVSAMVVSLTVTTAAGVGAALGWWPAGATALASIAGFVTLSVRRTAHVVATVRRGIAAVASDLDMIRLAPAPTKGPLVAPALVRSFGLRGAVTYILAIGMLSIAAFVPRQVGPALVIGDQKGYAGDQGPAMLARFDVPLGIAISASGDLFIADSNNHVVRKIGADDIITTVAGSFEQGPGFSGDFSLATLAQLDAPADVALAPDGDLLIVDSLNHRIRRVDRATGIIATIAGSGQAGFEGDGGPATRAALYWPSAVLAAPNGDIYIADTLNYRIRMIDHLTGFIRTIAGMGAPAEGLEVGDGGLATAARLNMPSDIDMAPNGDLYIADTHHQRVRRIDAVTAIISTVVGNGRWGHAGDDGPATEAMLAGPSGVAVVPNVDGDVTLFLTDYYNGRIRAVTPDGIIHDITPPSIQPFATPARLGFSASRNRLYVTDTSRDQLVVLDVGRLAPAVAGALPRRLAPPSEPSR